MGSGGTLAANQPRAESGKCLPMQINVPIFAFVQTDKQTFSVLEGLYTLGFCYLSGKVNGRGENNIYAARIAIKLKLEIPLS